MLGESWPRSRRTSRAVTAWPRAGNKIIIFICNFAVKLTLSLSGANYLKWEGLRWPRLRACRCQCLRSHPWCFIWHSLVKLRVPIVDPRGPTRLPYGRDHCGSTDRRWCKTSEAATARRCLSEICEGLQDLLRREKGGSPAV